MSGSQQIEERVVLRFLETYARDQQARQVGSVDRYVALFPGFEEVIREEYRALELGQTEPRRFGRFRLQRLLGHGGQGTVYLADDPQHRRSVALKVLPPSLNHPGSKGALRLGRELEVLARLDHPGIGVVYESGEVDGNPYLAMRYVPGESLAQVIERRRAAERAETGASASRSREWIDRCVRWAQQISEALEVAHAAGVVHRDVKPANVLLHDSGQPVLVDFGLARAGDSSTPSVTRTGDVVGTPQYMAPERLRGERNDDPRGDVWSVGALLHELLTGVRPFDGPTTEVVRQRQEREDVRDPRLLNPSISRDLGVVLRTALEPSLARRYGSAGTLAEELGRVLRREPIQARPLGWVGRSGRWVHRHPIAALMIVVLTVGLVASLWTGRELGRRAERQETALWQAQDHLSRSAYEEARLLRTAQQPERRWAMLERVRESARARVELVDSGAALDRAPSLPELRRVAFDALGMRDARKVCEGPSAPDGWSAISSNGQFHVRFTAERPRSGRRAIVVDMRSGEEIGRLAGEIIERAADGVAVDTTGRLVALVIQGEEAVEWWDVVAGARVGWRAIPEDLRIEDARTPRKRVWRLSFDPSGNWIGASVAQSRDYRSGDAPCGFVLWNLRREEPVAVQRTGRHTANWNHFSADARAWVAPSSESGIVAFDLDADSASPAIHFQSSGEVRAALARAGEPLRVLAIHSLEGRDDDQLVQVCAGRAEPEWSRSLGTRVAHEFGPAITLTDEEDLLFASEDRSVHCVSIAGEEILTLPGAHAGSIGAVAAVEGEGLWITEAPGRTWRCWRPWLESSFSSEVEAPPAPPFEGVGSAWSDISAQGDQLAMVVPGQDSQRVLLWDTTQRPEEGERLEDGQVRTVFELQFDMHGEQLARVSPLRLSVWHLLTGTPETLEAPERSVFLGGVFRKDGSFLAVVQDQAANRDGHTLVSCPGGESRALPELPPGLRFDLGPEGKLGLVMREEDERVHFAVWSEQSDDLQPLSWPAVRAPVNGRNVQFSPDGRWVSALCFERGWSLEVWRVHDGAHVLHLPMEGTPALRCTAFDASGRWLAAAHRRGEVLLHDLQRGETALHWRASARALEQVRFLEDGTLVTWGANEPFRYWDLPALDVALQPLGLQFR